MQQLSVYLPQDRRYALAHGELLPERSTGTALFADISGFTPLTAALTRNLGARQGAEELTRQINRVYDALIAVIDQYGGSVIGFAGDAVTCWFDDQFSRIDDTALPVPLRATACAIALQLAMRSLSVIQLPTGTTVSLGLKIAVASGPARRFVVGTPTIQLLDILAGPLLERTAAAEQLAKQGEVLLDATTVANLGSTIQIAEWRVNRELGEQFAVIALPQQPLLANVDLKLEIPESLLSAEQLRPWLLPAVYLRHQVGLGDFLTELRPVVSLFMRFTGIDYNADPRARGKLDSLIRRVQQTLVRYDATLIQVTIGDKGSYLYAAFGAPTAYENDAERAANSALEWLALPAELTFLQSLQIGISRGMMRAGAYGGRTRRTYGVLGDEVNVAARLMQYAPSGQVLVSGRIEDALSSGFELETLQPIKLKGLLEPLPIFRLLGERTQAVHLFEPFDMQPMVGREQELALISQKFDRALTGQGQVISITADAGMGKSRLVAEVLQLAHRHGLRSFVGICQSHGTITPYLVWGPIWSDFFDLDLEMPFERKVATLQQTMEEVVPDRCEALPLLGSLLDLQLAENDFTRTLEPQVRQSTLHALLIDYLVATVREGHMTQNGLLFVLEDVHWIDVASQELLELIGQIIGRLPVLIVFTSRTVDRQPQQLSKIEALPYFSSVVLRPLTDQEAEQIIHSKLMQLFPKHHQASPALVARVTKRAQGNPFYAEELLHYLHDLGIDPQDTQAIESLDLPSSLQTLILSRIDQLNTRQQAVLKVSSVIGRLIRFTWLHGAYSILGDPPTLKAELDELARLDITPLDTPEPDLTYVFKHIVMQEVTYNSLTQEARERLHEQLADWLEKNQTETASLALLAYHYDRSLNMAKRRVYLRRAGDAAAAEWANAAAANYYERLLEILPQDDPERVQVLVALGEMLERQGTWDVADERYTEALVAAKHTKEHAAAARGLGIIRHKQGAYEEAKRWLETARAEYAAVGDGAGAGRTLADLGHVYWLQGEYGRAQEMLTESQQISEAAGDQVTVARTRYNLGILALRQGEWQTARGLLEESVALYRAVDNRAGIASVLNSLGIVMMEQGEDQAARTLLEESLALRRELGLRWGMALTLGNLGLVAQKQGDWETARALHEESLTLSQQLGDRLTTANTLQNLGVGELEQGDRQQARAHLAACLRLCRELGPGAPTPAALTGAAAISIDTIAARLLGAVTSLLTTQGSALEALEQRVYDQTATAARAALGSPTYQLAFADGQMLSWEQAITEALEALAPDDASDRSFGPDPTRQ